MLLVLAGFSAGIALVLACGNGMSDAGAQADAPTCNCPAAAPPVEKRIRVVKQKQTFTPTNQEIGMGVSCDSLASRRAVMLGGSCFHTESGVPTGLVLVFSGYGEVNPGPTPIWGCTWRNPSGSAGELVATATCLLPEDAPLADAGP
jgi:hypothetical protein